MAKYGDAPSAEEIDENRREMFRKFATTNDRRRGGHHAALWHLYGDPRLSRNAREFIERASATGRKIAISSISLAEIVYLIEKGRIPKGAYENLNAVLSDPAGVFQETPVDNNVSLGMQRIARDEVPDMPDRIISGDRDPLRSSGY